jgi:hypothetical protein
VNALTKILAGLWLAALAASAAQPGGFAFAGFRRTMDLAPLLDRYPLSAHELTPGAGVRHPTSQDDEKAWMREAFHSRGSGVYVLRLAQTESRDHVYYVQAWIDDGAIERLWVSFELPLEWAKGGTSTRGNEARFPACHDVLDRLVATYGRPVTLPPRWEEALESSEYQWTQGSERMTLECGRYDGRKAVFAEKVTMEKAPVSG